MKRAYSAHPARFMQPSEGGECAERFRAEEPSALGSPAKSARESSASSASSRWGRLSNARGTSEIRPTDAAVVIGPLERGVLQTRAGSDLPSTQPSIWADSGV